MDKTSSLYIFSTSFTSFGGVGASTSTFFASSLVLLRFKIIVRSVFPLTFFNTRIKNPPFSSSNNAVCIALSFNFNKLAICKLLAVHLAFLELIKLLISAKINFLVIFKSSFNISSSRLNPLNLAFSNFILIFIKILILRSEYPPITSIIFLDFNLKIICLTVIFVKFNLLAITTLLSFKFFSFNKK